MVSLRSPGLVKIGWLGGWYDVTQAIKPDTTAHRFDDSALESLNSRYVPLNEDDHEAWVSVRLISRHDRIARGVVWRRGADDSRRRQRRCATGSPQH